MLMLASYLHPAGGKGEAVKWWVYLIIAAAFWPLAYILPRQGTIRKIQEASRPKSKSEQVDRQTTWNNLVRAGIAVGILYFFFREWPWWAYLSLGCPVSEWC